MRPRPQLMPSPWKTRTAAAPSRRTSSIRATAPQDPDDQIKSRFGGGQSSYQFGNSTLQFGSRPSFNERYNPNTHFESVRHGRRPLRLASGEPHTAFAISRNLNF